jgi:cytochrome c biogenesis protein CcdA
MRRLAMLALALLIIPATLALDLPTGVQKLAEYQQQLAGSITFLIALLAGILTFTSPCGFVVLPMFFSYVFKERRRAVLMTCAFAVGMALAFTLLGLAAGAIGGFLNQVKMPFATISGIVLVLFGILLLLNKGFSIFYFKLDHRKAASAWSTGLLGFFFAIGWTPCLGPILAGIMLLAANTGTALKGAAMLATYAIGVAIPLLLVSYLADRYDWASKDWIRGRHVAFSLFGKKVHTHTYNIIGGILLIAIGLLMAFQGGTFFFMERIPQVLPWTMELFNDLNERFLETGWLGSGWANALGIAIILLAAWRVFRAARHRERPLREV